MTTCTMDRKTFNELPDRNKLTGSPMPNGLYRDGTQPDYVFKWQVVGRHGSWAWVALRHVEPKP